MRRRPHGPCIKYLIVGPCLLGLKSNSISVELFNLLSLSMVDMS